MTTSFPTRQVLSRHLTDAHRMAAGPVPRVALLTSSAVESTAEETPLMAMVLGVDNAPRAMAAGEVAAFGDPFTRLLLLQGVVPLTLAQLDAAIGALADDEARPLRKLYAVAEGAAFQQTPARLPLNARLVFTWQKDSATDPDLLLSTIASPDDPGALLQLIAWSESQGAFHFFERLRGHWIWAGNSFDALRPGSRGRGPFDSHINGSLVMKELKFPWVHWHSQSRSISRALLFPMPALDRHPLFAELEGAQVLAAVVQRAVRRWTRRRMAGDLEDGRLANLRWYVRQLAWTTSVNLVSSGILAGELPSVDALDLPAEFFLDVDGFSAVAEALDGGGLLPDVEFSISSASYRKALIDLDVRVEAQPGGPSVPGDTDFAFVVPARAFEDSFVLEHLIASEVISPRLALCLLMVDFCNPVFSPDRGALLDLFPEVIEAGDRGAALDASVLDRARLAADTAPAARLLALWDDGDLLGTARRELADFVRAVKTRLTTDEGCADLLRLADSRRAAFRGRSLNEFRHTTASAGATVAHLAFDPAANVVAKASSLGEQEL